MEDLKGLSIILGVLAFSAAVTWAIARTAGRRLARRRPRLAALACPAVVPLGFLAYGWTTFRIEIAQHPTSDWPAMAMLGGIVFAGISILTSIPVSVMVLDRHRVRP